MTNLKKIRKEQGLTQRQVGELIGVTNQAVANYENGIRKLDQDQIIKIVKALNISADYFLGLIDEDKPTDKNKG